ncbi:N-acetylmuramoyl-L-alanine amidase [Cytobacillus sp. FJAT-54145]|uniref:N-acetylmuramoyl-L-alanine amidase n=1 Tax=Cytobacillus spartinae TaxID=3299023 RepID=A0ABW6KBS0_9BACI
MRISWDAGHAGYGVTSGKRAPDGSMFEWEFNNAVVRYAMEELSQYENVIQLRVDDPTGRRDVPLNERTEKINTWNSDVHLSIHANAYGSGWNGAKGVETYVLDKSLPIAYPLALKIQTNIMDKTNRINRGVKEANFHMLRESDMPAVLVEGGFMTNREELERLKSNDYRRKVASAIVEAIAQQFKLKKKSSAELYWDGMTFKRGQIGRISILKPINLWKRDEDDKLEFVRILYPGELYRVYGYDEKYGGQYNVGADHWITNMDGYVMYETPSKAFLSRARNFYR